MAKKKKVPKRSRPVSTELHRLAAEQQFKRAFLQEAAKHGVKFHDKKELREQVAKGFAAFLKKHSRSDITEPEAEDNEELSEDT